MEASNIDWTNDWIMEFLNIYEKHPEIWDPKNKNHKNRNYVADGWNSIKHEFSVDFSINSLKKKKECLMATYRTLKKKVIASIRTGTGKDDVYRPTWFAFETMHNFLKKTGKIKQTLNTEDDEDDVMGLYSDSEENGKHDEDDELTETIQNTEANNELNADTHPEKVVQSPITAKEKNIKKRALRTPVDIVIQKTMKRASDALEEIKNRPIQQQTQQDECSIFGDLVATKLKALSQRSRKILINQINNLLFNAEMAEMDQLANYGTPLLHNTFRSASEVSPNPSDSNSLDNSYISTPQPSPSISHNSVFPRDSTASTSKSAISSICGTSSQTADLTSTGCARSQDSSLLNYYSQASDLFYEQSQTITNLE